MPKPLPPRRKKTVRPRTLLVLEQLETRMVPSTFTVTTTADSGPGSLRQAILDANANPGKDTIQFDFSSPQLPVTQVGQIAITLGGGQAPPTAPSGVVVIEPTSGPLPEVTDPVVIDGFMAGLGLTGQAAGVEVRGDLVGSGSAGLLLAGGGGGSLVEGLIVNSFVNGIHLDGASNVAVIGCGLGVSFKGTNATGNGVGLLIDNGSTGNTVSDSQVVRNANYGVEVKGGTGNQFTGNFIADNDYGIEFHDAAGNQFGNTAAGSGNLVLNNQVGVSIIQIADGTTGSATNDVLVNNQISYNSQIGVYVSNAAGNAIGNPTAGGANVINENDEGVVVEGPGALGNSVEGNFIGLFADGTTADGLHDPTGNRAAGVRVWDAPRNTVADNVIADTNPGGTGADFAVDDGHYSHGDYVPSGIVVGLPGATGNIIEFNEIGTNAAGAALGGWGFGLQIRGAGGNAVQGNAIAATQAIPPSSDPLGLTDPGGDGIIITSDGAAGAAGNVLTGNVVGTDPTGTKALGNARYGIQIDGGSGNASGNTIGATTGPRNLISGNGGGGIFLTGAGASGTVIIRNRIGTNATGTAALPNQTFGVLVGGAPDTTIGGDATTSQNLISGNAGAGIVIATAGTTGEVIEGNFIGTDVNGTAALGNSGPGILLNTAGGTLIGGTSNALGNLISGNAQDGIFLDKGTTGVQVEGNYIGVDRTGSTALGNGLGGIFVHDSPSNTIGGLSTSGAGNLISGNTGPGIEVAGNGATGNVIQGNSIGTDTVGGLAIPNQGDGIMVVASGTTIGGAGAAANIIAGNTGNGITAGSDSKDGITAGGNVIEGNAIGRGEFSVPNGGHGVFLTDTAGNTIGAPGSGNDFDDNTLGDIVLQGAGTTGNVIQGNTVGESHHNAEPGGGLVLDGASGNTVGGTAAGAGNTFRYHVNGGILLTNADGNLIQGNIVSNNQQTGLAVSDSAGNTVGGSASAGAGNTISGNGLGGILLVGNKTRQTQVLGNSITNNQQSGILVVKGASDSQGPSDNQIGGTTTDQANTISGTTGTPGVGVGIQDGTGNAILVNSISGNAGLGIDLGLDGVTPNTPGNATAGPNGLQNYPVLFAVNVTNATTTVRGYINTTPDTAVTLLFYSNPLGPDASGHGEGQTYLGSDTVTTDAGGNANFTATFNVVLAPGTAVSATASAPDPNGGTDTSEFSQDVEVPTAEFQVNATTTGSQYPGNVGVSALGNVVAVWSGNGPQGSGIYFDRFDANNRPLGTPDQLVNTPSTVGGSPQVAVAPDGSFVVTWGSYGSAGNVIVARRYDANGNPLDAAPFQVNTTAVQVVTAGVIGMDAHGNFVIAWQTGNPYDMGNGFDISARRFAVNGTPLDAQEFTVNTTLSGNQTDPSVAVEPNGAFTIGWLNIANFFNAQPVLTARRFNADGTPAGGEFQLDNSGMTTGYAGGPGLAVGADGELAAVWAIPASTDGMYFRLFSANNTPLEAQPVQVTTQSTLGAVVSMGSDGHFVIAWENNTNQFSDPTNPADIEYASYAKDGSLLTAPAIANDHLAGQQSDPVVAVAPAGNNFVIGWDSLGQDGDGNGFFARHFGAVNLPPVALPLFVETGPGQPTTGTLEGEPGNPAVPQTPTYAIATNPTHGTLSNFNPATGAITYTPNAGFNGTDSFTYTVTAIPSDGEPPLTSTPAEVSITVVPPPIITGLTDPAGAAITDGVTSSRKFTLAGTALPRSVVSIAVYGTGVIGTARADANGNWSYTVIPPGAGRYALRAEATDASGNVLAASTSVQVLMDTTPPTSSVNPLPAVVNAPGFTVSWSGTDGPAGSGVRSFDVYVSVDGGAFQAWLMGTTETSAGYTGAFGHRYAFYSVATDVAGNRQATPSAAQAETTLEPRPITARLVNMRVGRKRRLMVEVLFADTGALKSEFASPFRAPAYTNIRVSVVDSNGDGVPDQVVLTARRGRKLRTAVFPG